MPKDSLKENASSSGARTWNTVVAAGQLAPMGAHSYKQLDSVSVRCYLLNLCDWHSREFEGEGKHVVSLRNTGRARWARSRQKATSSSLVLCLCGRRKASCSDGWGVYSSRRHTPIRGARSRDESYLVDPASSHMLVSKIKPCMSKYKLLYCETANGSLNQLSSIWLCPYYMDNRSNSRANTCEKSRLLEGMYLLD